MPNYGGTTLQTTSKKWDLIGKERNADCVNHGGPGYLIDDIILLALAVTNHQHALRQKTPIDAEYPN